MEGNNVNNKITRKQIDPNSKEIIKSKMKSWKESKNRPEFPFVELSKLVPYTAKTICQCWWNVLDPDLDHTPFPPEEKGYIYKWVEEFQKANGNISIPWKPLQREMKKKFNKFRSGNALKNIWYSWKRQQAKKPAEVEEQNDESEEEIDQIEYEDDQIGYEEEIDQIEYEDETEHEDEIDQIKYEDGMVYEDEIEDKNEAGSSKMSIQFIIN